MKKNPGRKALRDRQRAERKEAGRKKNKAAQRTAAGKETLLIITHRRGQAPRHTYRRQGISRFDSGTAGQDYLHIYKGNTMRVRRIETRLEY